MEASGIVADLGTPPNLVIRRKKSKKKCITKRKEENYMSNGLKGLNDICDQILEAEKLYEAKQKKK